jgi:membrane protease YdiL (CAAX protease family)
MIYSGLARVGDLAPIHDSFVTLFVVGIFLSMVRERTGNILWVIGIHAGWVMIIKATKYLTDVTSIEGNTSAWIGTYDSLTGWMATLWLAAISLWYWFRRQPAKL